MASFQAKIWGESVIKTIVLFRSNLMRRRKFQKNRKKCEKIKKNTVLASFKAKIGWKRPRKIENKNYHSVSFQPDT